MNGANEGRIFGYPVSLLLRLKITHPDEANISYDLTRMKQDLNDWTSERSYALFMEEELVFVLFAWLEHCLPICLSVSLLPQFEKV